MRPLQPAVNDTQRDNGRDLGGLPARFDHAGYDLECGREAGIETQELALHTFSLTLITPAKFVFIGFMAEAALIARRTLAWLIPALLTTTSIRWPDENVLKHVFFFF
jgi:hypothetical protein